jgi:hypothetical protein
MTDRTDRLRIVIQKLTEAIWNLDQLEPLEAELKEQYDTLQRAREKFVQLVKRE